MGLPKPESLSLSQAVRFVVKSCGCSEAAARGALLDAGRNGKLIANASVLLSILSDLKKIPAHTPRTFQSLRASDWNGDVDWKQNRINRFFDIRITQGSIEAWLAQAPAAPAQTESLRPAPDPKIHEAITAVYDEASTAGRKPPNLKQLGDPVRYKLNAQGLEASERHIQELASAERHKGRRRKRGTTVASETRRQERQT
jgi:hypothetical protein